MRSPKTVPSSATTLPVFSGNSTHAADDPSTLPLQVQPEPSKRKRNATLGDPPNGIKGRRSTLQKLNAPDPHHAAEIWRGPQALPASFQNSLPAHPAPSVSTLDNCEQDDDFQEFLLVFAVDKEIRPKADSS